MERHGDEARQRAGDQGNSRRFVLFHVCSGRDDRHFMRATTPPYSLLNIPGAFVRYRERPAGATTRPPDRAYLPGAEWRAVELMRTREFNEITVQDLLDRAGVGRATFYSHFRNK